MWRCTNFRRFWTKGPVFVFVKRFMTLFKREKRAFIWRPGNIYPPKERGAGVAEPLNKHQIQENHPSGAKARADYADFSGTAEAVPFQRELIQSSFKDGAYRFSSCDRNHPPMQRRGMGLGPSPCAAFILKRNPGENSTPQPKPQPALRLRACCPLLRRLAPAPGGEW